MKYQTADNKEYTGYFDWVAVKEKKDVYGNVKYEFVQYNEVDPLDVVQIVVIEKAPIYSGNNWEDREKKFYYYEDANGKIHAFFQRKNLI